MNLGFGGLIKRLPVNLKAEDLEKFMLSKLKFKKTNRTMKVSVLFIWGWRSRVPHNVTDISEETMQKTFRDAGMIGGYFRDAKDDLLSEYLVEFLKSYDESREFQPQKNRKRELKSKLEVNKPLPGLPSRR